ncbi:hypothetical protein [Simplicispira suum]|nr:hypothetical protein [Simplicispira suum]
MSKFIISVTYEHQDETSLESGEPYERGYEIEGQEVDEDELKAIANEYGVNAASSTVIGQFTWFNSSSPREDREYFEKGIEKFFSLHIKKGDVLHAARILNIKG